MLALLLTHTAQLCITGNNNLWVWFEIELATASDIGRFAKNQFHGLQARLMLVV